MNESDARDLVQFAIWIVITGSGPAVVAAMVVGIGIALLQALTQIQEMTLTFVPKIVVLLVVLMLSAPFLGSQLLKLSEVTYGRIASGF